MGRKIEIKKIENTTRCQVTYSKRKSSLLKKAHEISVFCDVDVAFLAFSPSGRLSKFCSCERMEDVLERYINLPPEKRYEGSRLMDNIPMKLQRLKELEPIDGDENKLRFLENEIKQLEQDIKKSTIELEITDELLKDYEPESEDLPLAQVTRCKKNLKATLKRVMDREKVLLASGQFTTDEKKLMEMERQENIFAYNFGGRDNQVNWMTQNLASSELLRQLDPWLNSNSAKDKKDLKMKAKEKSVSNGEPVTTNYTSVLPMHSSMATGIQIPQTHTPIQVQSMNGDAFIYVMQNEQQRVLQSPFMGLMHEHDVAFRLDQDSIQTYSVYPMNNWQNGEASTSQFHRNSYSEAKWINNVNCINTEHVNTSLPWTMESVPSPANIGPSFTNAICITTTPTTNNNGDRNHGISDENYSKQPTVPSHLNLNLESPMDLLVLNNLFNEVRPNSKTGMEDDALNRNTKNREDESWDDWDRFVLEQTLNMEDFDGLI